MPDRIDNAGGDARLPDELADLEGRLKQLQPVEAPLDREHLMFAAGQAAAQKELAAGRKRWLWPAATVAASIASLALGMTLGAGGQSRPAVVEKSLAPSAESRSEPGSDSHMAPDRQPPRAEAGRLRDLPAGGGRRNTGPHSLVALAEKLPPGSYLRQRQLVLEQGVAAISSRPWPAATGARSPASRGAIDWRTFDLRSRGM